MPFASRDVPAFVVTTAFVVDVVDVAGATVSAASIGGAIAGGLSSLVESVAVDTFRLLL